MPSRPKLPAPSCSCHNHRAPTLPPLVPPPPAQWASSAASFATIYFELPEGCQLASVALSAQRPLCLPAACLARCAALQLTARRVYLGLPLRRGAGWADVDELAGRWVQVGWGGVVEACGRRRCASAATAAVEGEEASVLFRLTPPACPVVAGAVHAGQQPGVRRGDGHALLRLPARAGWVPGPE